MTLGEHIARITLQDVLEGKTKKPSTKRILRKCLMPLRTVVDDIASEDAGKMALPACYGRHIIFASPNRGMICDMLYWSKPVKGIETDNLDDRASLWASMAAFIYQSDVSAALVTLATRLGDRGIAEFEETLVRLDGASGEMMFRLEGDEDTTTLMTRGALIVLAGVEAGVATGIIGALPVPVLSKPGPVEDWARDGNHRLLH